MVKLEGAPLGYTIGAYVRADISSSGGRSDREIARILEVYPLVRSYDEMSGGVVEGSPLGESLGSYSISKGGSSNGMSGGDGFG